MSKTFHETVSEMRLFAERLIPYSFPQVPHQSEVAISCLKQRFLEVDGYDLGIHFSMSDYGSHKLETVQVFGKHFTYLPFSLVSKVVKMFSGDKGLTFTEVLQGKGNKSRKIYIWMLYYDRDGICNSPFHEESTQKNIDGFKFYKVDKAAIKFF